MIASSTPCFRVTTFLAVLFFLSNPCIGSDPNVTPMTKNDFPATFWKQRIERIQKRLDAKSIGIAGRVIADPRVLGSVRIFHNDTIQERVDRDGYFYPNGTKRPGGTLSIRALGCDTVQIKTPAVPGKIHAFAVKLEPATQPGSVTVNIQSKDSNPTTKLQVELSLGSGPPVASQTWRGAPLVFSGLAAGKYRISAIGTGSTAVTEYPVVRPGANENISIPLESYDEWRKRVSQQLPFDLFEKSRSADPVYISHPNAENGQDVVVPDRTLCGKYLRQCIAAYGMDLRPDSRITITSNGSVRFLFTDPSQRLPASVDIGLKLPPLSSETSMIFDAMFAQQMAVNFGHFSEGPELDDVLELADRALYQISLCDNSYVEFLQALKHLRDGWKRYRFGDQSLIQQMTQLASREFYKGLSQTGYSSIAFRSAAGLGLSLIGDKPSSGVASRRVKDLREFFDFEILPATFTEAVQNGSHRKVATSEFVGISGVNDDRLVCLSVTEANTIMQLGALRRAFKLLKKERSLPAIKFLVCPDAPAKSLIFVSLQSNSWLTIPVTLLVGPDTSKDSEIYERAASAEVPRSELVRSREISFDMRFNGLKFTDSIVPAVSLALAIADGKSLPAQVSIIEGSVDTTLISESVELSHPILSKIGWRNDHYLKLEKRLRNGYAIGAGRVGF